MDAEKTKINWSKKKVLLEVHKKQVRSILEFAIPVWASSITVEESKQIERVQKCALSIILGAQYISYKYAISNVQLETLENRRKQQVLKFSQKALKHPKHKHWFVENVSKIHTRSHKTKFIQVNSNKHQLKKSPIAYMTDILNNYNK